MNHATPLRFQSITEDASAPHVLWQTIVPPALALQAAVVIPAKDEAASIEATLAALVAQTDIAGVPLPEDSFEILILANNCQDGTAAIARAFAARHPWLAIYVEEVTLSAGEAHIGKARRLLMDEACTRLEQAGHPNAFIASTDADTQVSSTWLAATKAALDAGADAVGGRILTRSTNQPAHTRRYQLQDATYQLLRTRLEQLLDPISHDPLPRHHQHFGASLACTVAAYRKVGGLPVQPYLEDEAFCQALARHDLRLRHSPAVWVSTSARQQGRVAVGLSWQLRQWAELHQKHQDAWVENPARLLFEWDLRRQMRQLWRLCQTSAALVPTEQLVKVAASLKMHPERLLRQLTQQQPFGALWESARSHFLKHNSQYAPTVPIPQALTFLRRELALQEAKAKVVAQEL